MASTSTTISIYSIFSIFSLLSFVGAINGYIQCPPPPPCICNPPLSFLPTPTPSPNAQSLPPPTPSPNAQPLPPPPTTLQPLPTTQPPPPQTIPPPLTQTTPPPPPQTKPTPSPPSGGICFRNDTESQICANILRTADSNLSAGRAEPCCSIIRSLSDVAALKCLCQSVGAKPLSLSPNINILFRTCTGHRIPQGFSCPGLSPTSIPPPPPNSQRSPPPQIIPSPPPQTTPLPPLPTPPQAPPPLSPHSICFRNDTESQICANILRTADSNLSAGRAEPCCSIIRSLSDVAALTCLCKSVGAKPLSLSPNINIFFRTCTDRRIPQGFSCPGLSPTSNPPPPPNSQHSPLPKIIPSPPPQTTPPPPPQVTPPLSPPSICFKNDTESQICANILRTADSNLSAGRAEPCCSIIRSLSDVAALKCLCKSVGARPLSLSPNINIFFRTCTGHRICTRL